VSAPYREPDHPPACERCVARDKRIADVRRGAARVATFTALGCVLLLMAAHTTFAIVASACTAPGDGTGVVALVLLTSAAMTLMVNKALADNTRRLALAAWVIAVSLAWAVFVGRAT
jgi:hypothetical protein